MKISVNLIAIVTALAALSVSQDAYAQTEYDGSSNIQLLFGETFEPENIHIATVTLEHSGSYGSFEQFGFIDFFRVTNTGENSAHLEWYPKVSLSRAGNRNFGTGPLQDILIGGGINTDFGGDSALLVWLIGPAWKFNIPGFDSFQLETSYYRQVDTEEEEFGGTYQITPSWDILLPLSDQWQFRFTGFADFIGDRGPGVHQIITQPQLLLDIGNFWNDPGNFYAGTEWHYWHNVGGVEGITESVLQLGLRVDL